MTLYDKIAAPGKKLVLLIDPDKLNLSAIIATIHAANETGISMIFIGGSLMGTSIDSTIETIKKHTHLPILLFPGSLLQLSNKADALLLLSLVSGRNPDYLIGNHVQAAPFIKQSGIEVIPTGYVLIDGGTVSSVEYVSNTRPIPANKPDLVVATSLAAEMLGNKVIYLEAGSGAINPVSEKIISEVKKNISVPLIVGGGLDTTQKLKTAFDAGADTAVVGNAVEKNIDILHILSKILRH
ncbi:MAG TPA: geranylgeranylglyceryl/heptaprenylglyceryl phosphate synthase [Bacteroidales bacterium]|jgi:phosphoglycerol geranylgeranyltransferase|nr:geranylgeranylglyceryl/heptaprenylglyceryl phosphate synthase [Bacteroidales bacterium]